MKRIKRLVLALVGALSGLAVILLLLAFSSIMVFFGTGADPSDAFRTPELANSSLSAELTWVENDRNAQLGTIEAERLGLVWADAFALIERRSTGEQGVDLSLRFDDSIAQHLGAPEDTVWAPFEVLNHAITIDFVSDNRQIVAVSVQVVVAREVDAVSVQSIDTYEAVLSNGAAGWTIVTFNRTGSLIQF